MLKLTRNRFTEYGIFGELTMPDGSYFDTLEHSYNTIPKLPDGEFTCVLGQHKLTGMSEPFQAYEITGVKGHTGILFHVGNTNEDSSGCVLIGLLSPDEKSLYQSRTSFRKFMDNMKGVEKFQLTVTSE